MHGVVGDLELVVAAIVEIGPLQLGVCGNEAVAAAVGVGYRRYFGRGRRGADG